jgi:hypothetical protein
MFLLCADVGYASLASHGWESPGASLAWDQPRVHGPTRIFDTQGYQGP